MGGDEVGGEMGDDVFFCGDDVLRLGEEVLD